MSARLKRFMLFWGFVGSAAFLVYVYPLARLSAWSNVVSHFSSLTALVLWVIVMVGLWVSFTGRFTLFKPFLMNWMGVGLVLFTLSVTYEFLRLFIATNDRVAAVFIIVAATILCLLSTLIANRFVVRQLEFNSTKLVRDYHVVQISDVHIGSRSAYFLRKLVDRINSLDPNYVVITGDLVDTSRVGESELAALADIKAETLFSVGNHDRYVGLDRLLPILERLGLRILRNAIYATSEADLEFAGIDDADHVSQIKDMLEQFETSPEKFRVLLYHRPLGWSAARDNGIELMLSGHTHHGQIFPFNWLVRQQFKRYKGLHKRKTSTGESALYVSPGTGTWGPIMRLGSHNEVTSIRLKKSPRY